MTDGPAGADAPQSPPSAAPGTTPATGLRAVVGPDFSVAESIGGVRGLVESVLPGFVFVGVYLATFALVPSLVASVGAAAVAVVVRLVQGTPVTQALSGVVGVGVGALWAWRTGEASDYYLPGLWTNLGYAAACVVSVLAGWPLVGVVVGLLRGEGTAWRIDPALAGERRRYVWATWLWAGMFALRLAVQLPLYLAKNVGLLGTARLAMGVPLWALTLWLTWLLVRARADGAAPPAAPASP